MNIKVSIMKNVLYVTLVFLAFYPIRHQAQCLNGTAQATLNPNNVKANVLNGGDLWTDFDRGQYFVPSDKEVSHFFAGGLWIGGRTPVNNIALAGVNYRAGEGSDYFPGPIIDGAADGDCKNWDRIWEITSKDIDDHLEDLADGQVDFPVYNVYAWPGQGNPHFEYYNGFENRSESRLAPFYDADNDGIYNPDNGDLPSIKGEQSLWWIINDVGGVHQVSQGEALGVEMRIMAYGNKSLDVDISNSTLYDVEVVYKGNVELRDVRFSLWADFDHGCHVDDRVGTDIDHSMVFAYNQDSIDGDGTSFCDLETSFGDNIPVTGIALLESQNASGMTSTINTSAPGLQFNSISALGYYNLMGGIWPDGTPQTEGNYGYNPGSVDTAYYCYPGNPATNEGSTWTSCNEGGFDTRVYLNSKKDLLSPGEIMKFTYAVVTSYDVSHPCPDVSVLGDIVDKLKNSTTSTTGVDIAQGLTVSPNPTTQYITVQGVSGQFDYKISSLDGQHILSGTAKGNEAILLQDCNSGVYFIEVSTPLESFTSKIVKH